MLFLECEYIYWLIEMKYGGVFTVNTAIFGLNPRRL